MAGAVASATGAALSSRRSFARHKTAGAKRLTVGSGMAEIVRKQEQGWSYIKSGVWHAAPASTLHP
jgi:hypothetical protein